MASFASSASADLDAAAYANARSFGRQAGSEPGSSCPSPGGSACSSHPSSPLRQWRAPHPDDKRLASLLEAVQLGNVEQMEAVLGDGRLAEAFGDFNVDLQTPSGDTLLMLACWYGHVNCTQRLLELGASVTITNQDGNSALNCAAYHGFEVLTKLLIQQKAPLEARDGVTGKTALIKSAYVGHPHVTAQLIQARADVNAKDDHGYSALAFAVSFDHVTEAELLLRARADPNSQDQFGITPLIHAAARGYSHHTRALLQVGADLNLTDNEGRRAIDYATGSGFDEVASLLQSHVPKGPQQLDLPPELGGTLTPRAGGGQGGASCATPRVPIAARQGGQSGSTLRGPAAPTVAISPALTSDQIGQIDVSTLRSLTRQLIKVASVLAQRSATRTNDCQYPSYAMMPQR